MQQYLNVMYLDQIALYTYMLFFFFAPFTGKNATYTISAITRYEVKIKLLMCIFGKR